RLGGALMGGLRDLDPLTQFRGIGGPQMTAHGLESRFPMDELSLMGIARKIQDLAARARAKQIKPDEAQGGTFSITNHGVGGSLAGTPIINQPQSGILGFGALEKRVKVMDDMIAI
ncbi:MAG TPA: 2-oxo acid dehydrogenase subunit E2, partial [Thermoflexales bacterium]|nr:2-oxo acid dehydrogenase subunit E2 [Thermoflexales bacterium]